MRKLVRVNPAFGVFCTLRFGRRAPCGGALAHGAGKTSPLQKGTEVPPYPRSVKLAAKRDPRVMKGSEAIPRQEGC